MTTRKTCTTVLAGLALGLATTAVAAPAASAESLQRQLLCEGPNSNDLNAALPGLVAHQCSTLAYNPETETFDPYTPEGAANEPLLGYGTVGQLVKSVLGV